MTHNEKIEMKINLKLTLAFFLVFFVPLAVVGVSGGLFARQALNRRSISHLESLATHQQRQIEDVLEHGLDFRPYLKEYIGLGETGEFVLAKRDKNGDALFIAPTRFDPKAAFRQRVSKKESGVPIILALQKKEGIYSNYIDYRGKRVVAVTRYLKKPGWGLVVKMDKDEVDRPANQLLGAMFLTIFIISGLGVLLVMAVSRAMISAINKAEVKLAESEEKFRILAESITDAMIVCDNHAKITFWNAAAEKAFGWSKREALGRPDDFMIPERYRKQHQAGFARLNAGGPPHLAGKSAQLFCLKKDGTEFPIELTVAPLFTRAGKFYAAVIRDISERVKLEKLRDDLIHMLIHDLKGPLSSIDASMSVVCEGLAGPLEEEQKNICDSVLASSRKMVNLVMNILDVNKMEEGRLTLNKTSFPAENFVENFGWVKNIARKDGKQIDFNVESGLRVYADQNFISRALENLLTNSLKHTKQGDKIALNIARKDGQTYFEVADNGEGVAAEDLGHIFEKFYNPRTKPTKTDTGLGLAFCKLAVEAHGGKIRVESQPGSGSKFIFTLPRSLG